MKYLQFTKQFAGILLGVALFASCKKTEKVTQIGDAGQTVVKILGGGTQLEPGINKKAIDFVSTPQSLVAVDLRRDVPNATELAKHMTAVVTEDTAAFRLYNEGLIAAMAAPIELLPDAWYTLNIPKVGGLGGTYTLELDGGVFAKEISVTIPDATVLDPSVTYGLAFSLTSADASGNLSAEQRTIILTIGAKNKYDGVYQLKGIHNRTPYTFPYDEEMNMITTGASSVIFFWPDAGSIGHPIGTGVGTVSWYGPTVAPQIVFDPATDLALSIDETDAGGPPIGMNNGANYPNAPDPAHPTISRYDPATKTIYAYWRYNNNPLRGFFDTLTYTKPR